MIKRQLFLISALSACALGQANPQLESSKAFYGQIKGLVLKSADKLAEEDYSFKPSPDVRSYGQVLAHIADAQYILCGIATTGKPVMKTNEKTAKTKAEVVAALKEGFAYCDAAYAGMKDSDLAAEVSWFGQKRTKLSVLDFNIAHGFEHYGNLVTYMRIKGVVPPSSEPQK
jgi:uncharacterized damage-inducible protein DinB